MLFIVLYKARIYSWDLSNICGIEMLQASSPKVHKMLHKRYVRHKHMSSVNQNPSIIPFNPGWLKSGFPILGVLNYPQYMKAR